MYGENVVVFTYETLEFEHGCTNELGEWMDEIGNTIPEI
jgi:hypothetical protein